jgi:Type IV pilus assembly protein PilM
MSLRDLISTASPDVAVEIDRTHVSAARLTMRGGQAVISAHASEALPPGAVVPGLLEPNMPDVPAVAGVIRQVVSDLGGRRPDRVALVLPDAVAKVSLLRLEKVPAKAADLQEIVKWQVRKTAPFPMETAVLSVSPGALSAEGASEFVVTVARAEVIHQYEQACAMAGLHAGLVDLSTFSVINSVLASAAAPAGDWLLVHVTDTYLTLAVIRNNGLLFFRNRSEEGEGTLADLIHQTAMYYEDRLHGTGFDRVMIAGAARLPGGADSVRRDLEQRLRIGVDPVDPRSAAALQDRIAASPELLDVLAPLVGMLLRERMAARQGATASAGRSGTFGAEAR